jgi:ABC-type multidrug transport system ATPase subunit/ABC-type multidrug transport system permease subunit
VAIVGGSGTGKTSLLHALNGFAPATSGTVSFNGVSLYKNVALFRSIIGYVPQDDIVHGELTVERTLYYGAKLRLPKDMRPQETSNRIEEVLAAVGLTQHRRTEVRRLSGGQRKRVSVALELLARPAAICLDEPTSGLDPALEGRMMALFRDLTETGTTVLVSTHVTQKLHTCDKVVWMAPGGRVVFFGSPAEVLRHFHVQDFGQIYGLLETPEDREHWSAAFLTCPAYQTNVKERLQSQPTAAGAEGLPKERTDRQKLPKAGAVRQLFWLSVRYAEVLRRDVPNLALLLLQAPAIGVALLFLFSREIFASTSAEGGDALRALMALHIVTASAVFLGASNAAREITKESAIYARERLVSLGVVPYVVSKVVILSLLCLFQAAVLVGIFAAGIDLPGSGWAPYPQLLGAIFLTEMAGLSMGLLVSTLSANSDRAMTIVPILLIPQLIFAGALVPLKRMLAPAKVISQLMTSKWALQLTGSLTHLGERFVAQFPPTFAEPYRDQFDIASWLPWGVLATFVIAMLGAAVILQKRKDVL